jgi:twinkle protein
MANLAEMVADRGVSLKSFRPGHTEHLICPKCHGGRTRENSLAVTVDEDGAGVAFLCHRGSCGWRDGVRASSAARWTDEAPRTVQRPQPHTPEQRANRPDWLHDFFGERNIGDRTIREFGVYATVRRYEQLGGERQTVVFPYLFKGELVNRKFRPYPEKQPQQQDKDALQTLFNVDRLGDSPTEIVWVEGEPDVMAMFECQIENAVSLKDGAPAKVGDGNEKRFEALRTHEAILSKTKRIILAGDMDDPGLALREELARRLGRHRCHIVTWPDGCKDACDVLKTHGPEAVKAAIAAAQPYPIAGLQRVKEGTLQALRRLLPPETMTTGAVSTDAILKLPTEGRMIVVTGIPGHGKTTWTRFVMVHTAHYHDRRWAVFSPEMQPWEQFAAECAEVLLGKPFWPKTGPNGPIPGMDDGEVAQAERWLSSRVTMLVCDAEDEAPTLDWILERARAAVLRDGVTDLVIDPWNEIDHQRGAMSETDYIGRGLQRLKAFGLRHGCNVWIIAHPTKPPPLKLGEKRPVPGPYDISGSAHWANKTDLGLTIHSPEPGSAEVHLWKPRFRRWGVRGSVAKLEFHEVTGRFTSPKPPDLEPYNRHWQED